MNGTRLFKYLIGCAPEDFQETAIISPVFSPKAFAENCRAKKYFKGKMCQGMMTLKNGRNLAIVHCGIGSGLGGDTAFLLASSAVNKIIFIGVCGGLADSRIGDIILCENAFNGEGFARYHEEGFNIKDIFTPGQLIPADRGYTNDLNQFLRARLKDGTRLINGNIFTIGSLLAEKKENLIEIEKRGYKGIEMELSSVYQAARIKGKSAAGLVIVSDLPFKKPLGDELTKEEKSTYNNSINEVMRISVEFALV